MKGPLLSASTIGSYVDTTVGDSHVLESIIANDQSRRLFSYAVNEFEVRGFNIMHEGCFSADKNSLQLQMCGNLEIVATAPKGIMEVDLQVAIGKAGAMDITIRTEKVWRSGFLSVIAMAAQKRVGCILCRSKTSYNNHYHVLTAILGISIASERMIPGVVKFISEVDQEAFRLREEKKEILQELTASVELHKRTSEKRENDAKKLVARALLRVEREKEACYKYVLEKEEEFGRLLEIK